MIKVDPDQYDAEVFRIATEKLFHHTIQFLEEGGKLNYQPVGSGVLIVINGRHLIFTASHVTAVAESKQLFITTPKGMLRVIGVSRETDLSKDKRLDVAYIILEPEVGLALAECYAFLPIERINHSHVVEEILQYVVVGFPAKSIEPDYKTKQVHSIASVSLLTGSKEKVYEHLKLDKASHFVLDYAGKGINLQSGDKIKVDPEPYGISGCGLWLITTKLVDNKVQYDYRLIGIMIELRKGKYHALIGNRVEFIMEALLQLEGFKFVFKGRRFSKIITSE